MSYYKKYYTRKKPSEAVRRAMEAVIVGNRHTAEQIASIKAKISELKQTTDTGIISRRRRQLRGAISAQLRKPKHLRNTERIKEWQEVLNRLKNW